MKKTLKKMQPGGSNYDAIYGKKTSQYQKAIAKGDSISKKMDERNAISKKNDAIKGAKVDSLNNTPGYNFRKKGGAIKTKK